MCAQRNSEKPAPPQAGTTRDEQGLREAEAFANAKQHERGDIEPGVREQPRVSQRPPETAHGSPRMPAVEWSYERTSRAEKSA